MNAFRSYLTKAVRKAKTHSQPYHKKELKSIIKSLNLPFDTVSTPPPTSDECERLSNPSLMDYNRARAYPNFALTTPDLKSWDCLFVFHV